MCAWFANNNLVTVYEINSCIIMISDVAFPTFSSQDFTEPATPIFLEGKWLSSSGGHTGGASGAVHQGPRPLGAHQRGPDSNFLKN